MVHVSFCHACKEVISIVMTTKYVVWTGNMIVSLSNRVVMNDVICNTPHYQVYNAHGKGSKFNVNHISYINFNETLSSRNYWTPIIIVLGNEKLF